MPRRHQPPSGADHRAWVVTAYMLAEARRYWSSADGTYVLDESTFDVWVGGVSTAALHAEFAVQDDEGAETAATQVG